eukprot:TRINITY_DN9403_c1_g1_i3.p1 TRINITY_DN9403_c1_g1~~TRINITY_DN9403_c1_g1_i3.p1  ORF type:complete len:691 (+),score=194.85 TRINITY_DN9403_c1_g1_i3:42-2114(+)
MSGYGKPARPPPSTPTAYRTGSPFSSAPGTPTAAILEDPSLLQGNIMRGRLTTMQSDLQKAKKEAKISAEKALQMSIKLNEEKLSKASLYTKYGNAVERVKQFDERMKEAEEIMRNEKMHHRELQKTLESLRDQLKQKQTVVDQQATTIKKQQLDRDAEVKGWKENLDRTSGTAEALREKQAQFMEHFSLLLSDSMDRLSEERDRKDAKFTVVTSELSSTITEQQQVLHRLQLEAETMRDSVQFLVKEVEEGSNALVITLLRENKAIWAQLNQARAQLARYKESSQSRATKLTEAHLKEQLETLQSENQKLEEKLDRANASLSNNVKKGQEHERNFQQLMDSLQGADLEKKRLQESFEETQSIIKDLREQISVLERQGSETGLLKKTISEVKTELQAERERFRIEADNHHSEILSLRSESERRVSEEITKIKKKCTELTSENDRLKKDLLKNNDQLSSLKRQAEDDRSSVIPKLKDELQATKNMYDREVEELRRELADTTQELAENQKSADKERMDTTKMRLEFTALSNSVVNLKSENATLHQESKRVLAKLSEKSRDYDGKRTELAELESALRSLEQEHHRVVKERADEVRKNDDDIRIVRQQLEAATKRCEDYEAKRLALEREIRSLQLAAGRDGSGRRVKEELEKDKELLSQENQRILREYEQAPEEGHLKTIKVFYSVIDHQTNDS